MSRTKQRPNICDYEGSDYRTRFWEGKGRDYEDRVERIALRKLLPLSGARLLEIGAGFGRLTDEYHNYSQVVLLDYSLSQLQYAQEHLGRDTRYVYVAADAYHLPFRAGVFDGATMIRVIHHIADVPAVLAQVRRVLAPEATFILEHANKRNLKAILRYALKRQTWNPHELEPVEFVELNFDFHPEYMREALVSAGFAVKQRLPVSFFRLPLFKERVSPDLLAKLDDLLQGSGLLYAPSIFISSSADARGDHQVANDSIFVCPDCGGELVRDGDTIICTRDQQRWAVRDGIYDFKAALD
jgi:SAM-dependent methyltransferase